MFDAIEDFHEDKNIQRDFKFHIFLSFKDEVGLDAIYKDNLDEESEGEDYEGVENDSEDLDEEEDESGEEGEGKRPNCTNELMQTSPPCLKDFKKNIFTSFRW